MTRATKRAVERLARRHGGHVTRAQLLQLGLTPDAIRHAVRIGFLIRVYHGVYAVGRLPTNRLDQAAGALLAAGPQAVLSHATAACLWRVTDRWPATLELTTPTCRRPKGLIVHRRPSLLPVDKRVVQGLWVTSPALTLLDMTPRLGDRQLLRAVNRQRVDHRLRLRSLHDVLERFPCHRGAGRLREILTGAPTEPFRSDWEIEWPPFAARHRLPEYAMNHVISGIRVDVFFPAERLIVELDGWGTHGTRAAFEADRERRNEILAETGIPTVAITYRQFHDRAGQQAVRLHKTLARRRDELRDAA